MKTAIYDDIVEFEILKGFSGDINCTVLIVKKSGRCSHDDTSDQYMYKEDVLELVEQLKIISEKLSNRK